jgi:hypothetical protein
MAKYITTVLKVFSNLFPRAFFENSAMGKGPGLAPAGLFRILIGQ